MKNKSIDPVTLKHSQDGLIQLAELLGTLANAPAEVKPNIDDIPLGGISGNKINGGTITNFSSVGIKDDSTRLVVLVNNDGIVTDQIDVDVLVGDTTVSGNLTVDGDIHAKKIHVDELIGDIRNSSSDSMEFTSKDGNIYNKGLIWSGDGITKQFVLRNHPDRFWASVGLDLSKEAAYFIGGEPVLSQTGLGSGVLESSLRTLGTLRNLNVSGNVNFGDGFRYSAETDRLGLGTESPNGNFAVQGWSSEFIVDVDSTSVRLGAFSRSPIELITDDTARITISETGRVEVGVKGADNARLNVYGKVGVGVSNVDDKVSIATDKGIQFEGKTFAVAASIPTEGTWRKGDVVWNSDPKPTAHVGWICVREGTPGEWKTFGQISS